jgi:hypothetical protein
VTSPSWWNPEEHLRRPGPEVTERTSDVPLGVGVVTVTFWAGEDAVAGADTDAAHVELAVHPVLATTTGAEAAAAALPLRLTV